MIQFGASRGDVFAALSKGKDKGKVEFHMDEIEDKEVENAYREALDYIEYPFTFNPKISTEKCKLVGDAAKRAGIKLSGHATYYISYGNADETVTENSHNYLLHNLKMLTDMGGERLVVHLGGQGKNTREQALKIVHDNLLKLSKVLDDNKIENVKICFEVLGKYSQIGNVEEVCEFTKLDRRFYMCLDFGHLNCLMQGGLKTQEDFEEVLKHLKDNMEAEKLAGLHVHWSNIQYGPKGEMRHLNLTDTKYGPFFEPCAKALKKYNIEPVIITESADNMQVQDAIALKEMYSKA
jgi:deoxyribonuclease-4